MYEAPPLHLFQTRVYTTVLEKDVGREVRYTVGALIIRRSKNNYLCNVTQE